MDRSGIGEIRKIFTYKSGDMAFGRFTGCFVNVNKEIKGCFNEKLLMKDKDTVHKYLDIYKKVLANDDVDVPFSAEDRGRSGIQYLLEKMRVTGLGNSDVIQIFYEKMRDILPDLNYVITLVNCTYDIPVKTSDKQRIDDASSEVFNFILCAVCPVKTSKGSLGYLSDIDTIGENAQQLVIDKPVSGFMYPSFNNRSTDTDNVLCYRTLKLNISNGLFSNAAPDVEKRSREQSASDSSNSEQCYTDTPMISSPSTSNIPSLDTGVLNNDAHYVREQLVEGEEKDANIIRSIAKGSTVDIGNDKTGTMPQYSRKPVRIFGDKKRVEKRTVDGILCYVVPVTEADVL